MGIVDKAKVLAAKQAFNYLCKDPANNVMKVVELADKLPGWEKKESVVETVQKLLGDPDSVWYQYYMQLWEDIDHDVLKRLFENFMINASFSGMKVQKEMGERYQCQVPWAIVMDPTSACNLKCTGCWAAEYGHHMSMDYDLLNSIVKQGLELGTYFYIFSGGEPLMRKDDIIRLCEAHPECEFLAFTNGTLIDEAFADAMLRVKNFVPAISVEGFEAATDDRRGQDTFRRLRHGMELLKERKLPFGLSCCYTSRNVEVIGSEAYFDAMVEWGAKFAWLLSYIPVGVGAEPSLMLSAEQRRFMHEQVLRFRQTKPIFTIDFWNDGEHMAGGCIAAGRRYLHINANGDIEPCAFIHYANHNVHTSTLIEALQGPLFQAYRHGQPFNNNPLRPCPLLDNPDCLKHMVQESGAASTEMLHPDDVVELTNRTQEAAAAWAVVADEMWAHSAHNKAAAADGK